MALTRARGKNGKLRKALQRNGDVECVELPLVEHVRLQAKSDTLPEALLWHNGDVCAVVTSPEGASCLTEAWVEAGRPRIHKVAVVGQGTQKELPQMLLDCTQQLVAPPTANARSLAETLHPSPARAVIASSARADTTLENLLSDNGFYVWRVDAYTTQATTSADAHDVEQARACDVVALASPSALDAWQRIVGELPECVACIGSTTAQAAQSIGIEHVYAPEQPGIDGWADACLRALQSGNKS